MFSAVGIRPSNSIQSRFKFLWSNLSVIFSLIIFLLLLNRLHSQFVHLPFLQSKLQFYNYAHDNLDCYIFQKFHYLLHHPIGDYEESIDSIEIGNSTNFHLKYLSIFLKWRVKIR